MIDSSTVIARSDALPRAVIRRFTEDQGFVLASALSFAFVLCLAPLALLFFAVAGFLLGSQEITDYLADTAVLVMPAYGVELAQFLNLLAKERAVTGLVGAVSWAVFATKFFSLVRTVLDRTFGVKARRSYLHGFTVDLLGVVVVGSLAIGVAVVMVILVTLSDLALRVSPMPLPEWVHVRRTISLPVIYITGLGLLFFTYRTFPNTQVPVGSAVISTLVVAGMWEVARWSFATYAEQSGAYGRLYGSFGIGVAALVWIYYSAVIFVLGAELAAVLTARRRAAARARPLAAPAPVARSAGPSTAARGPAGSPSRGPAAPPMSGR